MVTYPDRSQDAVLWIEVYTNASANRFDGIEDELSALAASSLVVQLELGRPVVKLLNLTRLFGDGEGAQEPISAFLNYIAGLVDDSSMHTAQVMLNSSLERASRDVQARFEGAPAFLERASRFVKAVGSSSEELARPAIHLSLDRPTDPGSPLTPDRVVARWPSLTHRLLWWQSGVVRGASHLFRPLATPGWVEGERPREFVPFPLIRVDDPAHLSAGVDALSIAIAHDRSAQRGFSLRSNAESLADKAYGDAIIGRSLELAGGLIDTLRAAS